MSTRQRKAGSSRQPTLRLLVLLLAACETGQCPTELDFSDACFDLSCVDWPKQPYVTITTPSGRVGWDSLRTGETAQLIAALRDTLGNILPGRTFQWRSIEESKAVVGASGVVTAVAPGTAQITAVALPDSVWGNIWLAITPGTAASVVISPADATIRKGESRTLVARAFDAHGFQTPDSVATWSSEAPAIAAVSAAGVVVGIVPGGPVRITASMAGKSASVSVRVIESASIAFAQLALGTAHTCGLTRDGQAYCWGSNSRGQLGDSTTVDHATIAPVLQGALVFTELAAGGAHTCARTSAGQIYCWGAGGNGELGEGGGQYNRPYPVGVLQAGTSFISLGAGYYHTCALTSAGDVYCWGGNLSGQVGDGSFQDRRPTPVRIGQGSLAFVSIAVGRFSACALTSAGQGYCWGSNYSGQLGDSTTTNRRTPVAVLQGSHTFTALAAGAEHTCGLTSAGAATCWGKWYQSNGGMTHGVPFPSAVVALGQHFIVLATPGGGDFQCGVASGGQPVCWGANALGQLGVANGTETNEPGFVYVGNEPVRGVATGMSHACAWMPAGNAFCWGLNSSGQLGDGTLKNQFYPVPVKVP